MPRPEDRGPQMLRVLMNNDVDFDPLRQGGVSENGIDFVAQLLNRDPLSRPKERECFQHPWIADVADVDDYEDDGFCSGDGEELPVISEDPEELDASQLSLNDDSGAGDSGDEDEIMQSKKPRIESPPADIRYPSLPHFESIQGAQSNYSRNPDLLFGEITASALQSSNALGANVNAYEGDDISFLDVTSSTGESMICEDDSMNSVHSLPENPFGASAPSLMGAENMVGQLNMNSTWHPGTPHTRRTPEIPTRRPSPGDPKEATGSNDLGSKEPSNSNGTTPKASRIPRRIDIPMPANGLENSNGNPDGRNNGHPGDIEMGPGQEFDIELASTLDAQSGSAIRELHAEKDRGVSSEEFREDHPGRKSQADTSSKFTKPRPLLGKLTTLPGSIATLIIRLEDRLTSWGRGHMTTVRYPDEMDSRIPTYALEVTFWAPGMEGKIKRGGDWTKVHGTMAILSTKTREHIWVNDTKLRRGCKGKHGEEESHYGKLYSGDIITVYRDRSQFLRFQCEFFHGDSARPRPENEMPFMVQKQPKPASKRSDGEESEGSGKSGKHND